MCKFCTSTCLSSAALPSSETSHLGLVLGVFDGTVEYLLLQLDFLVMNLGHPLPLELCALRVPLHDERLDVNDECQHHAAAGDGLDHAAGNTTISLIPEMPLKMPASMSSRLASFTVRSEKPVSCARDSRPRHMTQMPPEASLSRLVTTTAVNLDDAVRLQGFGALEHLGSPHTHGPPRSSWRRMLSST